AACAAVDDVRTACPACASIQRPEAIAWRRCRDSGTGYSPSAYEIFFRCHCLKSGSLLLDVPEHGWAGRDEASDVLARGGDQAPFAEVDVGRPFDGANLRGFGDFLQLRWVGLAREAIAQLFHLRIAGPAAEELVAVR